MQRLKNPQILSCGAWKNKENHLCLGTFHGWLVLGFCFSRKARGLVTTVRPWPPPRPVVAIIVMVDPTVQPWHLGHVELARVLGSGHHGLPMVTRFAVIWMKRCQPLYPLIFVPAYLIRIGDFSCFISSLYIEEQGMQSWMWNLSECLQRPFRLSSRNPKTHLVKLVSYL